MIQTIKTFRDFIQDDHKAQFAFLPLQLENCMLLQSFEKDEKTDISRVVLHVFDSKTHYLGTIENPHYIPNNK